MKRRLSFKVTGFIFALSVVTFLGGGVWIETLPGTPRWFHTLWWMIFLFFMYEIPSRIGPEKFDTPLSDFLTYPRKDKIILSGSVLLFISLLIVFDEQIALLSKPFAILSMLGMLSVLLLPILLLGSPDVKRNLFRIRK